jgi:hypothetical protein
MGGGQSSTEGLRACAVPWTGFEKEVLMLIRITCRNKMLIGHNTIDSIGFITFSTGTPKASYTGREEEIRILCGSV